MTISFNQDEWLKTYIKLNTELTKTAKNKFEKYFFKLMNNAVFEKNYRECKKIQGYKTWKNGKKEELFGVRTKFLFNVVGEN